MGLNRLDLLSARQLECVRRAARFQTSDEIAYGLGISPKTVDTHIAKAAEKLGVSGRRDAILLVLAADEQHQENSASEIPRVAPAPLIRAPFEAEPEGSSRLRDVAAEDPNSLSTDAPCRRESIQWGLGVNDLTALSRLAIIIVIALAIAIFLIAIPPLAAGFGVLANFIEPYRH